VHLLPILGFFGLFGLQPPKTTIFLQIASIMHTIMNGSNDNFKGVLGETAK
jgi:hypothetical protein